MQVIKRDKTKEPFQISKIENAIEKAFKSCNKETNTSVIECIISKYNIDSDDEINVEDIQDDVENCLMEIDKDVAKSYIIYRYSHKVIRETNDKLYKDITKKLMATEVQNQNANVDEHSFGGRVGEVNRIVLKDYALKYCMSRKSRNNHLNNEIYIHDLDSYAVGMHNCLTMPFDELLKNGFSTRQTDVRPANSINTAFQLIAVLFQLQSLQEFGGVSASHLDWTMIPYVRKSFYKHYCTGIKYFESDYGFEKLKTINVVETSIEDVCYSLDENVYAYALEQTKKELSQAVEGMFHNLNTLQSRSGNQLPFTSINFGTCTEIEGRMVIEALLNGSLKGVGKFHKTPIFPCSIFQLMKGVNREKGDPNYDLYQLALKSTSQRLYPNYANCDWSVNEGYDKNDPRTYMATMGCRTYNGFDINGFGQLKDGRGNICPVTLILPTLAMESKTIYEDKVANGTLQENETLVSIFLAYLKKKINDAKDMLIERFEWICSQDPSSAKFMWENNTMSGYIKEEGVRSALKHGTLAIGQLGLAECLQVLVGCNHLSDEGMNLAIEIESIFNKKCKEFKKKYQLNFGVYYTPAENLSHTALQKFRDKYGVIPNVSDREYFTNSMHVPVWENVTPFEKIDIESKLTSFSNAGCITYVELPSTTKNNLEALETIVNYAMDKDIPYFAVNVPVDTCNDCGYSDELGETCPICGSKSISRLRRVTGYLTGSYLDAFNEGKQAEVRDRVKHIKEF
jgi:ribonucleoside-triphosphate reductase (formate)